MRTIVMLNVPVTGHPLISSLFVSSIVIVTHQKICHHIQLILCELCLVLLVNNDVNYDQLCYNCQPSVTLCVHSLNFAKFNSN